MISLKYFILPLKIYSKLLLPGFLLVFFSFCGCKNKDNLPKETQATQPSVSNLPKQIIFVGNTGKNAGLFLYNFKNKQSQQLWSNKRETVIELSYSENMKTTFFLTASEFGKKGVFPFVNNIKLYSVDDSLNIKFIQNIGSGLQVTAYWTDANTYQIVLNSIDKTIAQYVEQSLFLFGANGKLLLSEKKAYDLTKDGYPNLPLEKTNLFSKTGKYVLSSNDKIPTILSLRNKEKRETKEIYQSQFKLKLVGWTGDDSFLCFTTLDVSPNNETLYDAEPQTSRLVIYSIKTHNVIRDIKGGGYKNFFLIENLLIYDDGFKDKSEIIIYDLSTHKELDRIKINGGCGIKNIPLIPDYEA
jgi:hypothetical protein